MSGFEHGLARAKRQRLRHYLWSAAAFVLAVLVGGGVVLFMGGTRVEITPKVAQDRAVLSVTQGMGLALGRSVYSFSRATTFTVEAPGFYPTQRVINTQNKGYTITVDLLARPARLAASTQPGGDGTTRWFIDGVAVGTGPTLERDMAAGTHVLRVDHPYYQSASRRLVLEKGTQTAVVMPLEAVAGRLEITASPASATIAIDGDTVGVGQVALNRPGGSYTIVVSDTDYETITETVALTNTTPTLTRHYLLQPLAAYLTVSIHPEGGQLLLNGTQITSGLRQSVSANTEHKLSYFKAGFAEDHRRITLKPGEEATIDMRLRAETGRVRIGSTPSADVYVAGRKRGTTPLTLDLPTVPVKIEVKRPGYRGQEHTLTPTPDHDMKLSLQLRGERAARLAEMPEIYKNSVGMELKRFAPTSFTMGTPRHVPGHRANEFEKRVTLKAIFYAGRHEVTNDQYRLFDPAHSGAGTLPVVGVSWIKAAQFCNWLSAREQLAPFYNINQGRLRGINRQAEGYRLLTEAEWEWLAGTAGRAQQTLFPWGEAAQVPEGAGNIADESATGLVPTYVADYTDSHTRLAPVGSYGAEASGLFDLTGNAREWVHDYYSLDPPGDGVFIDPLGPPAGAGHVVKGAGWRTGTRSALKVAYREGKHQPADDLGFRVARYLYTGPDATVD